MSKAQLELIGTELNAVASLIVTANSTINPVAKRALVKDAKTRCSAAVKELLKIERSLMAAPEAAKS